MLPRPSASSPCSPRWQSTTWVDHLSGTFMSNPWHYDRERLRPHQRVLGISLLQGLCQILVPTCSGAEPETNNNVACLLDLQLVAVCDMCGDRVLQHQL